MMIDSESTRGLEKAGAVRRRNAVKRPLPIGTDDFERVRKNGYYYVDKTMMIKDFIEMQDEVALIARPRRFGKTLNMTMLRNFFDITKDSRKLFEGLAIMDTEYAERINTSPVIYLTFKDCKATTAPELLEFLKQELYREYLIYEKLLKEYLEQVSYENEDFYTMLETLRVPGTPSSQFVSALQKLTQIVKAYYGKPPILLIDEYDQPIMSSYEFGYHHEMSVFFSNFYGRAMKGNQALGQALITGVQRVAKESIFSQFNNPQVYTVMDKQYAPYFGLDEDETRTLLEYYGVALDDAVRQMYDGYQIGDLHVYNPWSIINYAKKKTMDNYWVKTSANFLVKEGMGKADRNFWDKFERLITGEAVEVWITLDTSFAERESLYSLWGLLVNAGYLTVVKRVDNQTALIKVPNGEVLSEFQLLVAELSGIDGLDLRQMLSCLVRKDMVQFFGLYQKIVLSSTSYMDAKENAYHMLFLGMCIALRGSYQVMSNIESGHGRSDITLKSLNPGYPSIIVEFKQGNDIDGLKNEALQQILDNQYYMGLSGEVICVGLAHDKKRCQMVYRTLNI